MTKDLIKKSHVEAALTQQHGKDAMLSSWSVEDFTEKCDNYTSGVYCIKVNYMKDGEKGNTSYVVKVNLNPGKEEHEKFYNHTFKKEGCFYFDVAPLLNTELSLVGQVSLRIPKPFFINTEKGEEVFIMQDMRLDGFRQFGRTKSFDVPHTTLILKEFARLHGASMLLARRSPKESIISKFPDLADICALEDSASSIDELFSGLIAGCSEIAAKTEGYESLGPKIMRMCNDSMKILSSFNSNPSKFEAIVHLDCYSANYIFKYVVKSINLLNTFNYCDILLF